MRLAVLDLKVLICIQRSCGKRNGKDIQRISCLRFNSRWMIPFRLMVDVAVRKVFCVDCILVTFNSFLFIERRGTAYVHTLCDRLCSIEHCSVCRPDSMEKAIF